MIFEEREDAKEKPRFEWPGLLLERKDKGFANCYLVGSLGNLEIIVMHMIYSIQPGFSRFE